MNKFHKGMLIAITAISVSWAGFLSYSVSKDNDNKALFACLENGGFVNLSFEDLILNPTDYALVSKLSRKVWEDTKLTINLRNITVTKFAPGMDITRAYKMKCHYAAKE